MTLCRRKVLSSVPGRRVVGRNRHAQLGPLGSSAQSSDRGARAMNRFEQAVYDCMIPTAELLEETTKPLHRAILLNFWRHVHLEGAGEYERIVAPDMMVDEPVYRVTWGANPAVIEGKEGVLGFYNSVGDSVLWHSDDRLAVGDWGICRRDHVPPARPRRRPEGRRLRRRGRRGALPRREPAGVHLAVRQPGASCRRAPVRGQDEPRDRRGERRGGHHPGAGPGDPRGAAGEARG